MDEPDTYEEGRARLLRHALPPAEQRQWREALDNEKARVRSLRRSGADFGPSPYYSVIVEGLASKRSIEELDRLRLLNEEHIVRGSDGSVRRLREGAVRTTLKREDDPDPSAVDDLAPTRFGYPTIWINKIFLPALRDHSDRARDGIQARISLISQPADAPAVPAEELRIADKEIRAAISVIFTLADAPKLKELDIRKVDVGRSLGLAKEVARAILGSFGIGKLKEKRRASVDGGAGDSGSESVFDRVRRLASDLGKLEGAEQKKRQKLISEHERTREVALAAARENRSSDVSGTDLHFVPRVDPHEAVALLKVGRGAPMRVSAQAKPRLRLQTVRNDAFAELDKSGHLGRGQERDSRAQTSLGLQEQYAAAFTSSSARAHDPARVVVDGGSVFHEPETAMARKAQNYIENLSKKLGKIKIDQFEISREKLLRWVLADNLKLGQIAKECLGTDRRRLPLLNHFLAALDDAAHHPPPSKIWG